MKKVIIHHDRLKAQIRELKEKVGLNIGFEDLFSRCASCNAEIRKVDKKLVKGKVPQYVYHTQDEFYKCPKCKKIFWKGTHWDLANKYLQEILDDST